MCFRPSPVKRNDSNQIACGTCGMPIDLDSKNCSYCEDPVPQEIDKNFPKVDQPARII